MKVAKRTQADPRSSYANALSQLCVQPSTLSAFTLNSSHARSSGFQQASAAGRAAQRPRRGAGLRYAELHCKTNFSFLEGASHPDELALRAAELGWPALAITDRNSLAGVVRAHAAAKQLGLKLLIGAEIHLLDAPPVVLWATDRASYGRLARLITCGRRQAPKGECRLTFDDLAGYAEGLLCGVLPRSGRRRKQPPRCSNVASRLEPRLDCPRRSARYRELFGDRCYLRGRARQGARRRRGAGATGRACASVRGVPLVAAGDVHYHARGRLALHDVLTAIRLGTTVAEAGEQLFPNAERHLKSPAEMAELFAARAGGDCAHARNRRALHVLARRAALRISRGACARRARRRWSI